MPGSRDVPLFPRDAPLTPRQQAFRPSNAYFPGAVGVDESPE